jgi:hypothetical protein
MSSKQTQRFVHRCIDFQTHWHLQYQSKLIIKYVWIPAPSVFWSWMFFCTLPTITHV